MNENEYRARPELSYSDLIHLDTSPLHFKHRDMIREETEAMRKGTLLHMGVLEPERFKNSYALEPEEIDGQPVNRRIKAHREFIAAWRQTNEGKIFIRKDDFEELINMLNAIGAHPDAPKIIRGGEYEKAAFGEYNGVKLKGRCDIFFANHPEWGRLVVDLKKTQNASEQGFERAIFNYKYFLQAFVYSHLFKADNFIFIAVEDSKLAPIGIYRADMAMLEQGENMLRRLTDVYKRCMSTGLWPGYTSGVKDIGLPTWALAKNEI